MELTADQIDSNARILLHGRIITADDKGNLNFIAPYNLMGRLINFIRNLCDESREHRVNKVVLKTLEEMQNNIAKGKWTYKINNYYEGDFDIGYDKVAMNILLNTTQFDGQLPFDKENLPFKIREAAEQVMHSAQSQRKHLGMSFDCDHLPK